MAKTKTASGAVIQKMTDYPDVTFVTSGIKEIDEMVGGYPRGRITEIYGKKSVGKSTLMLYMLVALSQDYRILYIDAENALNTVRLKELGIDPSKVDFSTSSVLEEIGELILANVAKYDVIILDSIAGATTLTEMQSEVGNHLVGVKGKVMNSIFSRRLPELLAKSGCALILINQERQSFSMYGDPTYTPGGKAIEYAASLRLHLNTVKADLIIKDKETIGHKVSVKVTKSKISKPNLETTFKLIY
jgi:recombination protein RecA